MPEIDNFDSESIDGQDLRQIVATSKKKRASRLLGTNRISKRHRKFLFDVYPIFRFRNIHDFQIITKAGYDICALMDIDKNNRPID